MTDVHRYAPVPFDDDCVCVDLDLRADDRARQCADVLYGSDRHCQEGLLSNYPGCICVTLRRADASGRQTICSTLCRGGRQFELTVSHEMSAEEHRRLASALHGWLALGIPPGRFGAFLAAAHSRGLPQPILWRCSFRRRASTGLTGS